MSAVDWISSDQTNAWDAFVVQHPLGRVYHLSAWRKVLETSFAHVRGEFLAVKGDDGQIQAGLPVYSVKSRLLNNRTVSVPFATVSDPLISTKEDFDLLWEPIEKASREQKSKRIEIRTYRTNIECLTHQMRPGAKYKHHYIPLDRSADELFRSFHDSCIRRRVKKAIRAGVNVEEHHDIDSLRQFHAMLAATRRRFGLLPMPLAFFESMYRCLIPDHGALYLALHEGRPVGGSLALKFKDQWTVEYCGHFDDAPPGTDQLVWWHTVERAKNSGAEYFSLGRTSLNNEGLLDYKRRWGSVEEDLTDFVWLPGSARARGKSQTSVLHGAGYAAVRLFRHAPERIRTHLGNFCYRHLG